MKFTINVLIATSMDRLNSLINISLKSVLKQSIEINSIVIVDDNIEENFMKNKNYFDQLSHPKIHYIKNNRTKNMSGTGAWNTGFNYLKKMSGDESYVAILDDDDYWNPNYLEACLNELKKENYKAIFAYLQRTDCLSPSIFIKRDLKVENFLIGNPGIQGSNMFFKLKSILDLEGFDERMASCTDRDLLIRFLLKNSIDEISIIKEVYIIHNTEHETVTSDLLKKEKGLDYFYEKYLFLYSKEVLEISLRRSEKLFKYKNAKKVRKRYRLNNR